MCGLLLADRKRVSEAQVLLGLSAMEHRGADGLQGIRSSANWWLGHKRLAIRDRSEKANQPFHTTKGQAAAFVGEFFQTRYEIAYFKSVLSQGLDLLHSADGFWAIAQIGGAHEFVAVDFLGIKPMYYWPEQGLVCSEIKPMFPIAGTIPKLNERYLSNCIKWGYDYSGQTAFEGVYQIPPGHSLNLNTFELKRYWDWKKVKSCEDVRSGLLQSVEDRMAGERAIALLLSGGLDSSIVYYALKELGIPVEAFSFENGESEFLPPGVTTLPVASAPLQEALYVMEAPLDLGSLIPQMTLAKAIKAKGYNVCLTGDGADELFGGYRRAKEYDSQASDVFCELPYYHLPRLDKIMMSQTIELRSPFLSPAVIAYALQLPWGARTEKQGLKSAFAGLVPESILQRQKQPLKTAEVINGGLAYRRGLVTEFRKQFVDS